MTCEGHPGRGKLQPALKASVTASCALPSLQGRSQACKDTTHCRTKPRSQQWLTDTLPPHPEELGKGMTAFYKKGFYPCRSNFRSLPLGCSEVMVQVLSTLTYSSSPHLSCMHDGVIPILFYSSSPASQAASKTANLPT